MRVIGVLDLLHGKAVHARGGRRENYKPVERIGATLVRGGAEALARTYVDRCGVGELYVADLDAIAGGSAQTATVRALTRVAPLWLDAGVSTIEAATDAIQTGASHVVVGLETLSSFEALSDIVRAVGSRAVAFSLDVRDGLPIGSAELVQGASVEVLAEQAVRAGVATIIVLDLARVGAPGGPPVDLIVRVREAVPEAALIAGGGIRGPADLARVAAIGCDAALVASALHDGRLSAGDVAASRVQASVSR